ncbi:hypothetical protein BLGI_559 [Brevibacillus laterosporus GI-9]|nr:hypothetical protein BLGI_559 [Brevibacillus laterosporus GI-9]
MEDTVDKRNHPEPFFRASFDKKRSNGQRYAYGSGLERI